ncbi:TetR/AcrR family transcriptional regulator [Anaeroselena agilis]|uniref:TetR/AcrR family transcriptional regulator n=1 Tax=Anaeroselena agilis TaxID=3063788 RepID=A0ABU3NXM1_9FIRM|nr:TetR/AcrR family transcriptional regulator [Selenomonadales bacterium 4137-cl]
MTTAASPDTRDAILKAARVLFLTRGYHKTAMRTIARAAGISTGPLYFHFANKAEIFFHICLQANNRLLAAFTAAAGSGEAAGLRLRAMFLAHWDFFTTEPELFAILHLAENPMAGIDLPPELREKLTSLRHQLIAVMETVIREGIAAGELRAFDPPALALLLHSVADGVFQSHKSGALKDAGVGLDALIATAIGVLGHGMVLIPRTGAALTPSSPESAPRGPA